MNGVDGSRVLIVGGSSGLGRCIGLALAGSAAHVAFAGRRMDMVESAAAEAGGRAMPVCCDVRDVGSVGAAVAAVVESFGGLDALIYCAAVGPLVPLAEAGPDIWREAMETNVIGAALVTSAAVAHLERSGGTAVYLSSVSASQTAPWPGLGVYAVTKGALDKLVEAWNVEHPAVSFTTLVAGDCIGGPGEGATQFANSWDPELATTFVGRWVEMGYVTGGFVDIADLVAAVEAVLTSGARLPSLVVAPRPPVPSARS